MEHVFREYETQAFENIKTAVQQMEQQHRMPSAIFHRIVKQIYRREK